MLYYDNLFYFNTFSIFFLFVLFLFLTEIMYHVWVFLVFFFGFSFYSRIKEMHICSYYVQRHSIFSL